MLLLALVFPVGACDLFDAKACTLIGCRSQASITIRRADGMLAPLAANLDIDGRRVSCPPPASGHAAEPTCDDPTVTVRHRQMSDCHETRTATAVSLTCVPNGKFEQIITFAGTPARVSAILTSGEMIVAERAFALSYMDLRPNGPDCEDTCSQAAAVWELP